MVSKKNGNNEGIWTISSQKSPPSEKENHKTKFWKINKEMLHFKVHYFFFDAAAGASLPFLTIFAQERVGISASALAAILTSKICIFVVSKPAIGYLADYFNKLKDIIYILAVIATVSFFLLLAVPKIKTESEEATAKHVVANGNPCEPLLPMEVNNVSEFRKIDRSQLEDTVYFNNSNRSINLCLPPLTNFSNFLEKCSESGNQSIENASNVLEELFDLEEKYTFSKNNTSPQLDSVVCEACCRLSGECRTVEYQITSNCTNKISIESEHASDFQTYQFWLYAILATISMTCINGFTTLTDTACCESVQKSGAQFGRQRLWGAIGWGLLSPASGFLIDLTGDFLASWLVMTILSFIYLLNMAQLQMEKPQFSKHLLKDVGTVMASKEFLAFKFCVLMNGIGTGIMWYYLVLFLTDIGGSGLLCGLVNFVQCFLGEIPFMFFSEWAIRKIGHFNIQTLSLMAYCIRFFWYSQLHNPWLVLPAEVLHAFTFGLFYPNVASFAKISAKPGTEATTQAVLFAAHEGVGVGIGCVITGIGFDTVGGHSTFLNISIFFGFAMTLSIALNLWIRQQKGSIKMSPSTCA